VSNLLAPVRVAAAPASTGVASPAPAAARLTSVAWCSCAVLLERFDMHKRRDVLQRARNIAAEAWPLITTYLCSS